MVKEFLHVATVKIHTPLIPAKLSFVEDRRSVLQEHGRCFVCLKRGHMSHQYRSNSRCQDCRGQHHLSICAKKTESERQPSPTSQSSAGDTTSRSSRTLAHPTTTTNTQSPTMNPTAPPFNPPKSTSLWTNGSQAVLLQTAQALVLNPDDSHHSRCV